MERKQEMALVKFGIKPDELVHKEGRYWMTARQLGEALGFRKPRRSIVNLFNRHRKELQPFASVTRLMTEDGMRDTTIFDTDGQYRIALFANTQKAEKFRTFIVNMLKALERQEFIHVSQVMAWRKDLVELGISKYLASSRVMDWKKYKRMIRYRDMGLSQKETGKLLDVSTDTVKCVEAIPRKFDLPSRKLSIVNQRGV